MRIRGVFGSVIWLCLGLLVFAADDPKQTYQVPYRLSETKHIVVRARINGTGPFNFIVDTGAPALFVTKGLGKKLGVEPDKNGWSSFERFELEGGVVLAPVKARVQDIYQLDGMNSLGAAGVELHGMIGYNVLAPFRIEYDFTRDKMTWTRLNFEPVLPDKIGGKSAAGMDSMGSMLKVLGTLMGKKANLDTAPRGFLGIELADVDGGVVVRSVLEQGPAAAAGLKKGDRISHFQGKAVSTVAELQGRAERLVPGEAVRLTLQRINAAPEISFKAGRGL